MSLLINILMNSSNAKNLFTYCNNSSINYADAIGFWYYSVSDYQYKNFILKRPVLTYNFYKVKYDMYRWQYQNNCKKLGFFDKYIYDQKNKKVAELQFSSARIKDVGCEIIAIYNVMKLLGKFQPFANVISECFMNGLDWLSGHFGINPKNIYKYFDAHKIYYQKTTSFETWINRLHKKKRGILSAWNAKNIFSGLHTVMITYKNNKYYIYNAWKNSTKEEEIKTKQKLKEYMVGSFIIGYTF